MSRLTCILYNDVTECNINEQDIIFAKISHSECAIVTIVKHIHDNKYTNCRILIDDEVVLDGQINEIKNDSVSYTYTIDAVSNLEPLPNDTDELINKFKIENPSIFYPDIKKSDKPPLKDIAEWIIKDTLRTKINQDLPIHEINLNINASWLRCVYGAIDLTNKIKHVLVGRPLSTVTPNKLKHSWFKVFTPFYSNKLSRPTKYFVAHSKLIEESSTPITFNNKFTLHKTNFQYELAIGWEYEQLEYEEIQCKIINKLVPKIPDKTLNIDLHNVQEYMPDIYQQSFFKTDNGKKISNTILHEVIKYIEGSMYNIEVQFKIPIHYHMLSLHQPIKLKENTLYVQKIEYVYDANGSYINVSCIGSQYKNIDSNNREIKLPDSKQKSIGTGDIIDKIIIQNDADVQIPKVRKFASDKFNDNKIALREFLHKNQTKLIIKTKPLKTSYINKNMYEAMQIILE